MDNASDLTPSHGRPLWLELNAQRVTTAAQFYKDLFGWSFSPLHAAPWGSIPLISNGPRVFGNQFMAMGAFATPKWNLWFAGDLEAAIRRIPGLGGVCRPEIIRRGDHREEVHCVDPRGTPFSLARLLDQDPPKTDAPGDPVSAEYFGPHAGELAPFYAAVLDLEAITTPRGATLLDGRTARVHLCETKYEIEPPRWIPYFRSTSVGADLERARRAGGVLQLEEKNAPAVGALAVLADTANAYFGLLDPLDD